MSFIWSQRPYINILAHWSLSGIITSKLLIRESELPQSGHGHVDSDFTNEEFLGHYPIRN